MIKNISSVDAYAILQQRKNAVLIDVRSRMEYEYVGHPANSIHIAIQEPPSWELQLDFQDNVRSELTKKFSDSDKLSDMYNAYQLSTFWGVFKNKIGPAMAAGRGRDLITHWLKSRENLFRLLEFCRRRF